MTVRLKLALSLTACLALPMMSGSIGAQTFASNDALLDALVFTPDPGLDSQVYPAAVRAELDDYLARVGRNLRQDRARPHGLDVLVQGARTRYVARLVGAGGDEAAALAAAYVEALKPCYEWEGLHDCPEREAVFADAYQADHADGPFRHYLPLLSAHRWVCAAEGYDHEKQPEQASRGRRQYGDRLATALRSGSALIRAAARHLAARASCRARS